MSGSNPFRRDRPIPQAPTSVPSATREDDHIDASLRFPQLNIDTSSARVASQIKHVQFASPPAPETPLSYSYPSSSASSPESSRHAGPPASSLSLSTTGVPARRDPFHSDDSDTSNERQDEHHATFTGVEPSVTPSTLHRAVDWRTAELQSTSANVAAAPRTPSIDAGSDTSTLIDQVPGRGRQAIDVDAFKRLLLTGESGTAALDGVAVPSVSGIHSVVQGDSSSSTADSASVSRQSIFEPITSTSAETPRTSHELDFDDASVERRTFVSPVGSQARQKPSVPKARHGKKLTETNLSAPAAVTSFGVEPASSSVIPTTASQIRIASVTTDVNKPLPPPPFDSSFPTLKTESPEPDAVSLGRPKRPPTPPLARRQSQRIGAKVHLARSSSSKIPGVEDASSPPPPGSQNLQSTVKAPPPPPQRRLKRASTYETPSSENQLPKHDPTRRPSADVLADLNAGINTAGQNSSDPPSRTPSSASRISASFTGSAVTGAPPPLPPPRRTRGLSKSSFDSQRPASADLRRPSGESTQNVSVSSNATDILADLAALQREVDALRNDQAGRRDS